MTRVCSAELMALQPLASSFGASSASVHWAVNRPESQAPVLFYDGVMTLAYSAEPMVAELLASRARASLLVASTTRVCSANPLESLAPVLSCGASMTRVHSAERLVLAAPLYAFLTALARSAAQTEVALRTLDFAVSSVD